MLKGEMNADQIYTQSECTDQAMYLALYRLVKSKFVAGPSPYDEDSPRSHCNWTYQLRETRVADKLARIAVIKSRAWDPKIYAVSSLDMESQPHAAN